MKYKIKIEVLDDVMELNLINLSEKNLFFDLSNFLGHYQDITNLFVLKILNELLIRMKHKAIKNKIYRVFYEDNNIRISVKAL